MIMFDGVDLEDLSVFSLICFIHLLGPYPKCSPAPHSEPVPSHSSGRPYPKDNVHDATGTYPKSAPGYVVMACGFVCVGHREPGLSTQCVSLSSLRGRRGTRQGSTATQQGPMCGNAFSENSLQTTTTTTTTKYFTCILHTVEMPLGHIT